MNNPLKLFNRAGLLPYLVVCLTVLSLFTQQVDLDIPRICVSAMGLIAFALYYFDLRLNRPLFLLWAIVQLLVIGHNGQATSVFAAADVFDVTQGFKLPVYFAVSFGGVGYQAGVNAFALVLIGLIKFSQRNVDLTGKTLTFSAYKGDNELGIVFPLRGKVERCVNLLGEEAWLLIKLNGRLTYGSNQVHYALIKRSDKRPVIKNVANQLVFFKPVKDVAMLEPDGNSSILNFKDEVWALCE